MQVRTKPPHMLFRAEPTKRAGQSGGIKGMEHSGEGREIGVWGGLVCVNL